MELSVTKFTAFLATLLMWGVAHAVEEVAQPVVMPEPNYVGIIIFLLLMIGGCAWFVLKLIRNEKKNKE